LFGVHEDDNNKKRRPESFLRRYGRTLAVLVLGLLLLAAATTHGRRPAALAQAESVDVHHARQAMATGKVDISPDADADASAPSPSDDESRDTAESDPEDSDAPNPTTDHAGFKASSHGKVAVPSEPEPGSDKPGDPEDASQAVVELDAFESIARSEVVWVVDVFHPLCGSCLEFKPKWEALAELYKGRVKLGSINIADPGGMKLANTLNAIAEGIPNVRLYTSSSSAKAFESVAVGDGALAADVPALDATLAALLGRLAERREDGLYYKK
jgi:thiol-disulfide isomerase/thioredoxin